MSVEMGTVTRTLGLAGVQSRAKELEHSGAGRLQPMLLDWPSAVCRRLERESVVVRVVVADVRGSAPREAGACMLVSRSGVEGTIGGGHLEWQAIEGAARMLAAESGSLSVQLQRLTLGRDLAQCCGGVVELWLERFTRTDRVVLVAAAKAARDGAAAALIAAVVDGKTVERRVARADLPPERLRLTRTEDGATLFERLDVQRVPLWLYGAGHVGQAVVRTLAELPFQITWIDSRAELFPDVLPLNVRALNASAAADIAGRAPPSARHLVMTHDHGLDYDLCHAILVRDEFAWLGLIGSESKGARFRSRLRREGVAPEKIARLVCPIGVSGIASKLPAAIAVAVAAQLLQELEVGSGASIFEVHGDCSAESCSQCQSKARLTR